MIAVSYSIEDVLYGSTVHVFLDLQIRLRGNLGAGNECFILGTLYIIKHSAEKMYKGG